MTTVLPLPPIPSSEGKTITNGLASSSSLQHLDGLDPFVGKNLEQIPAENGAGSIPGYKGFIRGSQHFYGNTRGPAPENARHARPPPPGTAR